VLELDEDEGRPGDVADLARAEHDALEGAPALGHQGEAPLAEAAQRAQQRVAGPGVKIEFWAAWWLPHRDVHAAAGAFVAGGVNNARMFPPNPWALPEYHRSISRPFLLMVFSLHRQCAREKLAWIEHHLGRGWLHRTHHQLG
jgi:hypothetical protein